MRELPRQGILTYSMNTMLAQGPEGELDLSQLDDGQYGALVSAFDAVNSASPCFDGYSVRSKVDDEDFVSTNHSDRDVQDRLCSLLGELSRG